MNYVATADDAALLRKALRDLGCELDADVRCDFTQLHLAVMDWAECELTDPPLWAADESAKARFAFRTVVEAAGCRLVTRRGGRLVAGLRRRQTCGGATPIARVVKVSHFRSETEGMSRPALQRVCERKAYVVLFRFYPMSHLRHETLCEDCVRMTTIDERLHAIGLQRAEPTIAQTVAPALASGGVSMFHARQWLDDNAMAWDEWAGLQLGADACAADLARLAREWRIDLRRLRDLWRQAEAKGADWSPQKFVRNIVAPLGAFTVRGKAFPTWQGERVQGEPRINVRWVVGMREARDGAAPR